MIRDDQISIVVQGDIRANTHQSVAALRRQLPRAEIVLSTFKNQMAHLETSGLSLLVDKLCVSDDPGAMPPTVNSPTAPPNNINRMLVSTQAGLKQATRPYALKLRSDAECDAGLIVSAWEKGLGADDPAYTRKLGFASHFTRHPHGINGYTFHPSDWLTFGRTKQVQAYWDAPLFTEQQATWFDGQPRPEGLTVTTRRFRSQFTQEQWLCVSYARRIGYATPAMAHDRRTEVVCAYERFLVQECVVLGVEDIGLMVPKQAWARKSCFQDLDCVSYSDWMTLVGRAPIDREREAKRRRARQFRHLIACGILFKKWLTTQSQKHLCRASNQPKASTVVLVPKTDQPPH